MPFCVSIVKSGTKGFKIRYRPTLVTPSDTQTVAVFYLNKVGQSSSSQAEIMQTAAHLITCELFNNLKCSKPCVTSIYLTSDLTVPAKAILNRLLLLGGNRPLSHSAA